MEKRYSKTKEILKYAAIGTGILTLSLFAPQLPLKLIKAYLKDKKFQRYRFLQDIKRLQQRNLLGYKIMSNDRIRLTLLRRGKEKVVEYDIDNLKLNNPKRWDGKWRLVMFDIPNKYHKARNALRSKLKELEFYQLQESVYLLPWPCEDQIDFIASVFNIRKYLLFLTLEHFEGEEKLEYHYRLIR